MTETFKGELEIDHVRGVIYFHSSENDVINKFNVVTLLRICRLPKPIPKDSPIDITNGFGVSYVREVEGPEYFDGCDHEGFEGGCERFGHTPETCPYKYSDLADSSHRDICE